MWYIIYILSLVFNIMFIPIIVAATRPNAKGADVGKAISSILKENFPEISYELVSPNDFNIAYDDSSDPKFAELTKKADAFIFVISEYNHGYPGRFKSLLDSEFDNYSEKFALLVGVSNGVFGGARAIENILPVMKALNIRVTRKDIVFREAQTLVNQNGDFMDLDQKQRCIDTLKEFISKI